MSPLASGNLSFGRANRKIGRTLRRKQLQSDLLEERLLLFNASSTLVSFPTTANISLDVQNPLVGPLPTTGNPVTQSVTSPVTTPGTGGTVTSPVGSVGSTNTNQQQKPVVNIDQAWLTARQALGTYYLDQAGTRYVLQTDVTARGTAFAIIANDITLDLNGYKVTYDNAPAVVIPNGSFEQGSGNRALGWDFNNAPTAARVQGNWLNNEVYDGQHGIKFLPAAKEQWVTSTKTITLAANTQYSLSAMFEYGGAGVAVNAGVQGYVRLVSKGLPTREVNFNSTNYRGIQLREGIFTTGSKAETYQVLVGVRVPTTVNLKTVQPFFIDNVRIQQTNVHGVVVGGKSWGAKDLAGLSRFGDAKNAVVENGIIVQGADGATRSHGVLVHATSGVKLRDLDVTVHGANSSVLFGSDMGSMAIEITNNRLTSNVKTVTNRDAFDGAVIRDLVGTIAHNTILNGPHSGIISFGRLSSTIFDNTIQLKARYTNAFAIFAAPGSQIFNNLVDCGDGECSARGIMVSGGKADAITRVFGNTIRVQQLANNQEYQGQDVFGAYGIQLENASHAEVFGNDVTAYGLVHRAFALRINNDPGYQSQGLVIRDNTLRAISVNGRAAAFKFHGVQANQAQFLDNRIISNDGLIGETVNSNVTLVRSLIEFTKPVADSYVFSANYAVGTALHSQIDLLDTRFANAMSEGVVRAASIRNYVGGLGDNRMSVQLRRTARVHLLDAQGGALAGALVQLTDPTGKSVGSAVTDASGVALFTLLDQRRQGTTLVGSTINTVTATIHQAQASLKLELPRTATGGGPLNFWLPMLANLPQLKAEVGTPINLSTSLSAQLSALGGLSWKMVSGPGRVAGLDGATGGTQVTVDAAGDYLLELSRTQGGMSSKSLVNLKVAEKPRVESVAETTAPSTGTVENSATSSSTSTPVTNTPVTNVSLNTPVANAVVQRTVNIDAAWLDARKGDSVYYLDQKATLYVLQTDVTVRGTGFVITADHVTLDLNGYKLTYDNAAAVPVPNGSFEQNADGVVQDWDLSTAPQAQVVKGSWINNEVYQGERSLKFALPGGSQYITSTKTVTLAANTTYSLSAMFEYGGKGTATNPGVKGFVKLVGEGLPTREVSFDKTNYRGIQLREGVFTTGNAAETYTVQVGVEVSAKVDPTKVASFFIDDIRIQQTKVYGVVVGPKSWSASEYPGIDKYGFAKNATVRNGIIVQGQNGATFAHGVMAHSVTGLTIEDLDVTVHGANSSTLFGNDMAKLRAVVTGNTLTSNVTTVTSRDNFNGAVVMGLSGVFAHNSILNGPHAGYVSFASGMTPEVYDNTIQLKAKYTNAFAIVVSPGSLVHNNVINSGSGEYSSRGIMTSGGSAEKPTKIYDNVIQVQQLANNQEYEGANVFGAYGIQLENASYVEVYGNEVTANANVHKAFAFRVNEEGKYQSQGLNIHDNTFRAVAGKAHAAALKFSSVDKGAVQFVNNTLITNDGLVGETDNSRVELVRSRITVQSPQTGAHVFSAFFAGGTEMHSALSLVDTVFQDSASEAFVKGAIVRNYASGKADPRMAFELKRSSNLTLTDSANQPVPNATYTVTDPNGVVVFSGETNAQGQATAPLTEFKRLGSSTQQGIKYTVTLKTPTGDVVTTIIAQAARTVALQDESEVFGQ